jgi:hypothetical protein
MCQTLLAGADEMKIGFVTRSNMAADDSHVIVGTHVRRACVRSVASLRGVCRYWGLVVSAVVPARQLGTVVAVAGEYVGHRQGTHRCARYCVGVCAERAARAHGGVQWAVELVRTTAKAQQGDTPSDEYIAKFVLLKDPNK